MESIPEIGGYLSVFGGMLLEGESVFLSGIAAAHLGYLQWRWLFLSIFLGAQIHDWVIFLVAKYRGRQLLAKRPKWKEGMYKIQDKIGNNINLLLLTYRFLIGLRILAIVFIGMSQVDNRRFAIFSLISTLSWMIVIGVLGYFFTEVLIENLEYITRNIGIILLIIGLIALVYWLWLRKI